MPDDDLAAELDHISACIEIAAGLPMTADPRRVVERHAPRLVAALEAVLKLADTFTAPAVAADCLDEELAEVRRECGERVREAVTRALKGDTDA